MSSQALFPIPCERKSRYIFVSGTVIVVVAFLLFTTLGWDSKFLSTLFSLGIILAGCYQLMILWGCGSLKKD
jgi:hypothetical protein